ncbi:bifunctional diaminohydroxyphosphoribosylaminopyrimidine deaminase/5-amino-6-(5-phosphoribosylamino)uracil reductase RibD [bacterium]|nr:bifunctional diaminohydroxyphosphoribosylaminopyrimidine deaminase/5-amino-6-(5-phosphoribosylamino)uracil reductase RibD [bacterium]
MNTKVNPYTPGTHEYYMYEALRLAHGGMGWAAPNPMVGCVLVREQRIIGGGFHARDGEQHAEVNALENAGDARGATAYVSLEPCSHQGRQPSCCHELARAGIAHVVWGADDVDPRTAGCARAVLAELGITNCGRALVPECTQFLDYYLQARRLARAFMHLKLALSLDGKVACANGDSQWLSGPASLGYAHYLRYKYDAVLVSYRTVFADNPHLTVRPEVLATYHEPTAQARLRQPVRVVLDARFEIIPRLTSLNLGNLTGDNFRETLPRLIVIGAQAHLPRTPQADPQIALVGLPTVNGRLAFKEISSTLFGIGIHSVLVEGGGGLAAAMLAQQAVDKLTLVYTPHLIGADGIGFTPAMGLIKLADGVRLESSSSMILGSDALMEGYPKWE